MLTIHNKSPSDDQELLRTGSEVKRHNLIVSTRSPRLLVLDPEYPNSVHEIRICVLHMLNVQRGANRKGRAELPGGSGRRAATAKPPSGRGPASSSPPNRLTRSRMPIRPWPAPLPGLPPSPSSRTSRRRSSSP